MKSTTPITANQKKTKILITGATGATGGHAITDLLRRNIPVRALVHKIDERSEKLRTQGVEIALGDMHNISSRMKPARA